jgi:hypothetical protein
VNIYLMYLLSWHGTGAGLYDSKISIPCWRRSRLSNFHELPQWMVFVVIHRGGRIPYVPVKLQWLAVLNQRDPSISSIKMRGVHFTFIFKIYNAFQSYNLSTIEWVHRFLRKSSELTSFSAPCRFCHQLEDPNPFVVSFFSLPPSLFSSRMYFSSSSISSSLSSVFSVLWLLLRVRLGLKFLMISLNKHCSPYLVHAHTLSYQHVLRIFWDMYAWVCLFGCIGVWQ